MTTALDHLRKVMGYALSISADEACTKEPPPGAIKCELDGEPIGGVCFASIEIDRDGDVRLILFRDRRTAYQLRALDQFEAADRVALWVADAIKNK
jgi:hypothetical protein